MAPYVYDFGVHEVGPQVTESKPHVSTSGQNGPPVPIPTPALSAADFSSKPHDHPQSAQLFKDATIGAFCDGNLDVRHDGVTLTALTPDGPAEQSGIRAGDTILSINDHYLFTIRELQEEIARHHPGTTVAVRYRRYSTIYETQIVIGHLQ